MQHPFSISPLGDSAIVIDFGAVIEKALNQKVSSISRAIKDADVVGITDIVPAYCSITVHYDAVTITAKHQGISAFITIREQLENLLLKPLKDIKEVSRQLKIPVCYATKYALDIKDIAAQVNLTVEEIAKLHTARKYRVYMVGFLPGFAYMGEVDERIAVPRKQEPRLKIEEGYVGIAGKQTGIYPLTSPGGWQIIGRTPVKLFDRNKEEPVLFAAGDEIEFFSITEDEFENY